MDVAGGGPSAPADHADAFAPGRFKSFGDSSIHFELRAWTSRFERWPVIRTELAGAIYAALHAAGMSLPFPQREVRLLRDDAGAGQDTVSRTRAPTTDKEPG